MLYVFFFNDTATTEIYTLSLHDALPICCRHHSRPGDRAVEHQRAAPHLPTRYRRHDGGDAGRGPEPRRLGRRRRSEEHTSELQSRQYLVCRLLLEKKKQTYNISTLCQLA